MAHSPSQDLCKPFQSWRKVFDTLIKYHHGCSLKRHGYLPGRASLSGQQIPPGHLTCWGAKPGHSSADDRQPHTKLTWNSALLPRTFGSGTKPLSFIPLSLPVGPSPVPSQGSVMIYLRNIAFAAICLLSLAQPDFVRSWPSAHGPLVAFRPHPAKQPCQQAFQDSSSAVLWLCLMGLLCPHCKSPLSAL